MKTTLLLFLSILSFVKITIGAKEDELNSSNQFDQPKNNLLDVNSEIEKEKSDRAAKSLLLKELK